MRDTLTGTHLDLLEPLIFFCYQVHPENEDDDDDFRNLRCHKQAPWDTQ